ncbi:MAG: hypothetical protein CFH02_00800 [Alphaproteobacteria bacterium MarineAlpha3_Bin1]|nr:MAG: hypothetical protein CFH02_00800 [Alphaproteobacteria bacterium MarineAlpha3_Bin1]
MLHCNISTSFPDNVPEKSGLRAWTGTAHSPRVAPTSLRREASLFKLAPDFGQGFFYAQGATRGPKLLIYGDIK